MPVCLYRWKCGWLLSYRFMLLGHIGRRTRLHRHTVLEVRTIAPMSRSSCHVRLRHRQLLVSERRGNAGTRRAGRSATILYRLTRRSYATCPTSISLTQPGSCWCRTISISTRQLLSIKPSQPLTLAASSSGSNGTTPPKHGSWLDMAEAELSVLSRQCLDQHIPDRMLS